MLGRNNRKYRKKKLRPMVAFEISEAFELSKLMTVLGFLTKNMGPYFLCKKYVYSCPTAQVNIILR